MSVFPQCKLLGIMEYKIIESNRINSKHFQMALELLQKIPMSYLISIAHVQY